MTHNDDCRLASRVRAKDAGSHPSHVVWSNLADLIRHLRDWDFSAMDENLISTEN